MPKRKTKQSARAKNKPMQSLRKAKLMPSSGRINHTMLMIDESDCLRDEITGRKRKSSAFHVLNKKKVSKWELDELFAGDEY